MDNHPQKDNEAPSPGNKVRKFMAILEQLPRLCSPTICGTLSQPTPQSADLFEWSLEQKAILSPANITTDDWQNNVAEINPLWRQQESDMFFSQNKIAPSPTVAATTTYPYLEEETEDRIEEDELDNNNEEDVTHNDDDHMDNLFFSPQPLKSSQTQQRMDVFSPDTFTRVMEDHNTLQSTPKTTGLLPKTRTRSDLLD